MIKTRFAHLAAIVIFAILFFVWNGQRQSALDALESSYINKALAAKDQENRYTVVKKPGTSVKADGYAQSSLSSDFVSKIKDEQNKSIVKINYSISRKVSMRLDEFKPFIESVKADGKDFVVTFIPVGIDSVQANGYNLFYQEDGSALQTNIDFLRKLSLLMVFGILIKIALMSHFAYMQHRKTIG